MPFETSTRALYGWWGYVYWLGLISHISALGHICLNQIHLFSWDPYFPCHVLSSQVFKIPQKLFHFLVPIHFLCVICIQININDLYRQECFDCRLFCQVRSKVLSLPPGLLIRICALHACQNNKMVIFKDILRPAGIPVNTIFQLASTHLSPLFICRITTS